MCFRYLLSVDSQQQSGVEGEFSVSVWQKSSFSPECQITIKTPKKRQNLFGFSSAPKLNTENSVAW